MICCSSGEKVFNQSGSRNILPNSLRSAPNWSCFDAEANAIILLRLPLLVVEAISMAKASKNEGPLRATEHELGEAEVHCMAASQAAVKNGLYM